MSKKQKTNKPGIPKAPDTGNGRSGGYDMTPVGQAMIPRAFLEEIRYEIGDFKRLEKRGNIHPAIIDFLVSAHTMELRWIEEDMEFAEYSRTQTADRQGPGPKGDIRKDETLGGV